VRSPRRIGLTFDAAEVGQLRINEFAEALVAPALLPRGSLNHRLLLALKEVRWLVGCWLVALVRCVCVTGVVVETHSAPGWRVVSAPRLTCLLCPPPPAKHSSS
jgi:hypothetical protein